MKDLTKGNIYKTFLLFAIPMVLSSLLSQAYSTIDTIMAGKLLGDNALAAIGALSHLKPLSTPYFGATAWAWVCMFPICLAQERMGNLGG